MFERGVVAAVVLGAACGLAGCAEVAAPTADPVAPAVEAGYDAFRAGNQPRLEQQIQALGALLPADQGGGAFTACTDAGYALRRIARLKRGLETLDGPGVLSNSDMARFLYFETVIIERGDGGEAFALTPAGDPDCDAARGHDRLRAIDDAAWERYRTIASRQLAVWVVS
jgi:hypothetical protein